MTKVTRRAQVETILKTYRAGKFSEIKNQVAIFLNDNSVTDLIEWLEEIKVSTLTIIKILKHAKIELIGSTRETYYQDELNKLDKSKPITVKFAGSGETNFMNINNDSIISICNFLRGLYVTK